MLRSQLADLEPPPPDQALWVNAMRPVTEIVDEIVNRLGRPATKIETH